MQNKSFLLYKHAIQIQLYIDDFQIVNPLGNKTNTYKITGLYFTIGNIPRQFRAKSFAIKKYGFGVIFSDILTDLKVLENEGICFIIKMWQTMAELNTADLPLKYIYISKFGLVADSSAVVCHILNII